MDSKVKAYLDKQESEKQKIILKLRKILLKTLPSLKEMQSWGVISYSNLYYLAALKKQVNMGFSILGLSSEEVKLFEGTGKTMRHLKFQSLKSINEKKLVKIIQLVKKKAKPVEE